MIMGVLYSLGLIVLLWDILANPKFNFFYIMIFGLSACLLITFVNLFFFYTVLWTPTTVETSERFDKWGNIAIPARTIRIGEYEINMEIFLNNKLVAFAMLGFGAVTSFIFIFVVMIRSLGNSLPLNN